MIAGDYLRCDFIFQNKYNYTLKSLKLHYSYQFFETEIEKKPIEIVKYFADGSGSSEYSIKPGEVANLYFYIQIPQDTSLWPYWFNIYDDQEKYLMDSALGFFPVMTYSDYLAGKNMIITVIIAIVSTLTVVILTLVSIKIQKDVSEKQISLMKKKK